MSGKKKKSQKTKAAAAAASASQNTTSDEGPARIGAANKNVSGAAAATNSSGGGDGIIRDLPPPSQTVQPRGAAAKATPGGADAGEATMPSGGGEEVIAVVGKNPPRSHFSHLEQPIPMTHSYSLPSLPTTSLQPRMSAILVDGGGAFHDPSSTSLITRDLSTGDLQQAPNAPVPILSRTLSTPESSSSLRSAFGRAGSAFGRFSTAASRPNTTYTQSDPGFSAFHPVTWSCQRSLSSAGSGSLVGSEIIEEHDGGSGLKTSAKTSSNNMTRGFLLKAREKLQTTKRRSGRENPARPSLSDTEDATSPPTTITTNDDGVEISITAENKSVPPTIDTVPPSKVGALRKKRESDAKSKSVANEGQHDDPGLELNFSDDSDDDGSIDEVNQPSVEVALKPHNRPPSRADNTSQVPFDERVQAYSHATTPTKTSAAGAVAAKFKFKSPQRRSKVVTSPSSYAMSSSPHQSPNAGTTSSSSNGSPNSRTTISSNSNSISSAGNMRNKINSATSSPGGGDSCARESMGSSTTNSEVRDIVVQKKNKRQQRQTGKAEGNVEDGYETVSVDMDGNATVHSSSACSCSSACLREGAINPHIGLTHIPGRAPSVSPGHEAPFDEHSNGSPGVGGNTDSTVSKKEVGISKFISFNSKKAVRSQSPDAHTTSSASASNASVSNATSSSSGTGGGSQQPVMFVAYESVEEREDSPFDEHHHEENRNSTPHTPHNLIRPTIAVAPGQRPPTSPRKSMSGRISVTPPPTHVLRDTPLSGAKTPCSPPTIADGPNVLVGDLVGKLAKVEIGSSPVVRRVPHRPKTTRMKMILVPPRVQAAPTVVISPERHHSQESAHIEGLQQQEERKGKHDELNSAIVSPEKAT